MKKLLMCVLMAMAVGCSDSDNVTGSNEIESVSIGLRRVDYKHVESYTPDGEFYRLAHMPERPMRRDTIWVDVPTGDSITLIVYGDNVHRVHRIQPINGEAYLLE